MNEGCSLISIPPAADVAAIQDSAIQRQEDSGGASTYCLTHGENVNLT